MHHFRSSSIKDERDYLVNCWEKCLDAVKAIHQLTPAYKFKVCDSNNNMEIVKLTTTEETNLMMPVEIYNGWFWDSGTFPLPSICSALLEDSTLSFWQTRGTARAAWGQRKSLALKRSSRTPLSWIWVPAQLVDTPMVHRFKEYLRR